MISILTNKFDKRSTQIRKLTPIMRNYRKASMALNQENTGSISGDKVGTHVWWDKAGVDNGINRSYC